MKPDEQKMLIVIRAAAIKAAEAYGNVGQLSPLEGCCGPVSRIVRIALGGAIVTGRVCGEPHFWNRLPSGEEVDLTSCQFGGDGFTPHKRGRRITRLGERVPIPHLVFASAVYKQLRHE